MARLEKFKANSVDSKVPEVQSEYEQIDKPETIDEVNNIDAPVADGATKDGAVGSLFERLMREKKVKSNQTGNRTYDDREM